MGYLRSAQHEVRETKAHLRILFDEEVGNVDLFQGVPCSKSQHHTQFWLGGNTPNTPSGVDEVRTRIIGAINIDRPTGRQNRGHSRTELAHSPKESANSSLPQPWYINVAQHWLVEVECRHIVRVVHPDEYG